MERADVVVVGGGPAGSSLAFGLRDAGLRVVVLDRREFPRDKTCAGWITPPVLEALAVDPEVYAKERVLQPIRGFRVRRIGGREARADLDRVVSFGIRRCELDHFLLARCEAELRLGEPLRSLERAGAGWVVNGALEAPLVVGAAGHFCPVARRLATGPKRAEPIVAARELEQRLRPGAPCPVEPAMPELFFTEDLRGYGWVFRKGDWLNVGLGRQDKRHLAEHVERFVDFLRAEGRLPAVGLDIVEGAPDWHGHAYLLYDQAPRRLVDASGLALVGDAAGLAYPRSGEGIRPAVESGLLLARALRASGSPARALRTGGSLAAALRDYERRLLARLGPRAHRRGPTDWLPAPLVRSAAAHLLGRRWFARHVVVERWFVHAHEPALPA